jgi:hypothetical protein
LWCCGLPSEESLPSPVVSAFRSRTTSAVRNGGCYFQRASDLFDHAHDVGRSADSQTVLLCCGCFRTHSQTFKNGGHTHVERRRVGRAAEERSAQQCGNVNAQMRLVHFPTSPLTHSHGERSTMPPRHSPYMGRPSIPRSHETTTRPDQSSSTPSSRVMSLPTHVHDIYSLHRGSETC